MNFEALKIPLLASSILFFLIALYLHIIRRWKSKSKTLKYPHLLSLDQRKVNGMLHIKYELFYEDTVEVNILDKNEEALENLLTEIKPKGRHEVIFDTTILSPGYYFYQLITSNQKTIKRFEKV